MKKRYFYQLISRLKNSLHRAELNEELKGNRLFEITCHYNFDYYAEEVFMANIEHKLARIRVKMIKKELKEIKRIHNV